MKPKAGSSWVWRSILHGRDMIKKDSKWCIGSGASVNIRDDIWLTNGRKAVLKEGCNLKVVQELIDPLTHSWNVNAIHSALHPDVAIEALKVPIGWSTIEDKLIWPHTKEGNFSVKSGYWCISEVVNLSSPNFSSSYVHPLRLGLLFGN